MITPRRPTRRALFHTAALALLGGCCGSDVGCVDGLAVLLADVPTGAFRVEVTDVGGSATAPPPFECAGDAAQCGRSVFFQGFAPSRVRVRLTAGMAVTTQELTPTYVTARPNGQWCGPECRVGTAAMTRAAAP